MSPVDIFTNFVPVSAVLAIAAAIALIVAVATYINNDPPW